MWHLKSTQEAKPTNIMYLKPFKVSDCYALKGITAVLHPCQFMSTLIHFPSKLQRLQTVEIVDPVPTNKLQEEHATNHFARHCFSDRVPTTLETAAHDIPEVTLSPGCVPLNS